MADESPNWHALAAIRVHNLPDNWIPFEAVKMGESIELVGAVPLGVEKDAGGQQKYRWPTLERWTHCTIRQLDVRIAKERWSEANDRKCFECLGRCSVPDPRSRNSKVCDRCSGVGKL